MVEAAIVLPLLFLVILSIILVMLYLFQGEKNQSQLYQELIASNMEDRRIFFVQTKTQETRASIRGVSKILMYQKNTQKCYVINPADGVRAGDLFQNEKEKDEK